MNINIHDAADRFYAKAKALPGCEGNEGLHTLQFNWGAFKEVIFYFNSEAELLEFEEKIATAVRAMQMSKASTL